MKKLIAIISALVPALAFLIPELAEAASITVPNYGGNTNVEAAANTAGSNIVSLIMIVAGVIGVIAVSYGGLKMMTGKPDEGKQIVSYSLIGVFVVETAAGLVSLAL